MNHIAASIWRATEKRSLQSSRLRSVRGFYGNCVTSQPPPSARTRLTLEANWRLSMLMAVIWFCRSVCSAVRTSKITSRAAFVARVGDVEGVTGGVDGALLCFRFLLKDAERGELVFNVVEGLEDGVAIAVGLSLVGVAGDIGERVALAGVEEQLGRLRAEAPERAGTLNPGAGVGAFKAAGSGRARSSDKTRRC